MGKWDSQLSSEDRGCWAEEPTTQRCATRSRFCQHEWSVDGKRRKTLHYHRWDVWLCFSPIEEPVKHLMTNYGTC